MRRLILLLATVLLTLGLATAASAHSAPPCNDADGDGMPSGAEYAAHHITSLAHDGGLGNDGHKPGSHGGFSACDPSGR